MKSSSHLFELIKSMTKGEKRHFRLENSKYKQKEKTNFLKLFNAIEEQDVYQEEAIKKKFGAENKINNYRSVKHRLYYLVLESLTIYKDRNKAGYDFSLMIIGQIQVLFNKKLYEQCAKLIVKAKAEFNKKENFISLLKVIDLEIKIIAYYNTYEDILSKRTNLLEESQAILEKQSVLIETKLFDQENRLLYAHKSSEYNESDKNQLLVKLATKKEELEARINSVSAAQIYYQASNLFYIVKGDWENSYKAQQKQLAATEQLMELNLFSWDQYFFSLFNLMAIQSNLRKFDEQKIALKKFTALEKNLKTERDFHLYYLYYHTIKIQQYLLTRHFDKAALLYESYANKMTYPIGSIDPLIELNFHYIASYNYFITGDYETALSTSKLIQDKFTDSLFPGFHGAHKVLNMLTHIELGNLYIIESLAKSTYRYFKKNNLVTEYEKKIFNFMQTQIQKEASTPIPLTNLQQQLKDIKPPTTNDKPLKLIDFQGWMNSKIKGTSFQETINF